jgi:uncharacterized membrane protein
MKNIDLIARSQILKSIVIPFPYLGLLGMIVGYMSYGILGTIFGIIVAITLSIIVGIITTTITNTFGKSSDLLFGRGKSTINLQERLEGELQQARYHKMNQRYDEALRFVEGALNQTSDFPDALFLKAQILWEGFQDSRAARECIKELMKILPNANEPLYRWANHLLTDIKRGMEG